MTMMCQQKQQQQQPQPLLKMRMKLSSSKTPVVPPNFQTREELEGGLRAMVMQEASNSYKCRDYLTSKCLQRSNGAVVSPVDEHDARRTGAHPTKNPQPKHTDVSYNHCINYPATTTTKTIKTTKTMTIATKTTTAKVVDTPCRQKMVLWSYRLIDYFRANREIVAMAFSYLDRFMNCQQWQHHKISSSSSSSSSSRPFGLHTPASRDVTFDCYDRASFKLAAMTSLYLAAKLFHTSEISMTSLAGLSQGEFDVMDIADMERALLDTLEWKLHPPTIQDFIRLLQHFCLPPRAGGAKGTGRVGSANTNTLLLRHAIVQRALFFAELAVFDSCFVAQPRSAIAMAALLNSMEGMEESFPMMAQEDHLAAFSLAAARALNVKYPRTMMESLRNRLWYVYSQSGQYQDDELFAGRSQQRQAPPAVVTPPVKSRRHNSKMTSAPMSRKQTSDGQQQGQEDLLQGCDHSPISIVSTATRPR